MRLQAHIEISREYPISKIEECFQPLLDYFAFQDFSQLADVTQKQHSIQINIDKFFVNPKDWFERHKEEKIATGKDRYGVKDNAWEFFSAITKSKHKISDLVMLARIEVSGIYALDLNMADCIFPHHAIASDGAYREWTGTEFYLIKLDKEYRGCELALEKAQNILKENGLGEDKISMITKSLEKAVALAVERREEAVDSINQTREKTVSRRNRPQ